MQKNACNPCAPLIFNGFGAKNIVQLIVQDRAKRPNRARCNRERIIEI